MTKERKVVAVTDFTATITEDQGKQWYWTTSATNGKTIGDGSEGYNRLTGSVEGFFAQQGLDDATANAIIRGDATLSGDYSKLERISADHFRITKYGAAE